MNTVNSLADKIVNHIHFLKFCEFWRPEVTKSPNFFGISNTEIQFLPKVSI